MTNNLINLGTFTAPYREFEFSIPPNGIHKLVYDHQLIEILENNLPDNVTCCFGGVGGFTKLEVGIMYRYPDNNIIPYVQFKNEDAVNTATLRVAVAVGDMKDNRLTVSGTVTVQGSMNAPVYIAEDYSTSLNREYSIGSNGKVTISAYTASYKKVLIQNTSDETLRIEAANGFILPPTATFEWRVMGKALEIFGTPGKTFWTEGYK